MTSSPSTPGFYYDVNWLSTIITLATKSDDNPTIVPMATKSADDYFHCGNCPAVRQLQDQFFADGKNVDVLVSTVLYTTTAIVGAVGNTLVIAVCGRYPSPNRAHLYILLMAITDLLVCLICLPYRIASYRFLLPQFACKSLEGLTYFTVLFSFLLLIAVSADRYCAICRPVLYHNQTRKFKYLPLGLLLLAASFASMAGIHAGHFRYVTMTNITNGNHVMSAADVNNIGNERVLCYTGVCMEDGEDIRLVGRHGEKFIVAVVGTLFSVLLLCVGLLYSRIYITLYRRFYRTAPQTNRSEQVVGSVTVPDFSLGRTSINGQSRAAPVQSGDSLSPRDAVDHLGTHVRQETLERVPRACAIDLNAHPYPPDQTRNQSFGGRLPMRVRGRPNKALTHRRVVKILLLVTIVYILTYLPFALMKLRFVPNVVTMRLTFFLSSLINPLIHSTTNKKVRKTIWKLIVWCRASEDQEIPDDAPVERTSRTRSP